MAGLKGWQGFFLAKEVSLEDVEETSGHSGFNGIAVLRENAWLEPTCWCLLVY